MTKKFAYIISRLLGPLPMLCLLWLVTALKSGVSYSRAIWVYPLIFLVGIIIPTLISVSVMRVKKIDFEWTNLKDRKLLIPIYFPLWLVVLVITWQFTNLVIFHLALITTLQIIIGITLYTYFHFKASAHMMIASGTFWGVNFMTHGSFWWLFLLLIPLMWARLKLKQHSFKELIAGLLVINVLDILALLFFGWLGVV